MSANPPNDDPPIAKLCQVCRNIFDNWDKVEKAPKDVKVNFPHYDDYLKWIASAENGCVLCMKLLRKVSKDAVLKTSKATLPGAKARILFYVYRRSHQYSLWVTSVTDQEDLKFSGFILVAHEFVYLCSRLRVEQTEADKRARSISPLMFATKWVKACIDTHEECRTEKVMNSPTRLIEVYDGGARLFSPPKETFTPYLTLSHCWGTLDIFKLKKDNIDALRNDIPLSSLCKTFQQAMTVTQMLGFRYIWIDSLCIIQDDKEDWLRESSTMADVYGNGAVNIAATHAKDGSMGLFGQSSFGSCRHLIHTKNSKIIELWDFEIVKRCLVDAPLGGRAWAFQERFLSSRTIHFSAEEIFCECRCGLFCEDWPTGIPFHKYHEFGSPFPKTCDADDWARVVHYYSRGQLTFAKDKLVALSGVARKFQSRSQDQYCAGLWRSNLELSLCWKVETDDRPPQDDVSIYHGPSWSWICTNHVVSWRLYSTDNLPKDYREHDRHQHILIRVMDVHLVTVGPDPFGQLQDAKLTVECGPLFNGSIIVSAPKPPTNKEILTNGDGNIGYAINVKVYGVQGKGRIYFDNVIYSDFFNKDGSELATLHFLPIFLQKPSYYKEEEKAIAIYGQVLTAVKGIGKGHFVRVGVWDIRFEVEAYAKILNPFLPNHPSFMDEELYGEVLGPDENGVPRYLITLV